jgi:hypothetical protein
MGFRNIDIRAFLWAFVTVVAVCCFSVSARAQDGSEDKSIGGEEHETSIYGVRIGMDIPTALRAVFVNAQRKPGQEKPDALRKEGKGNRDVRVVYKELPKGELQIVFADGAFVKEIVLRYREEMNADDLRLPFTSTIGSTTDTVYDTSATQSGTDSPAVLDGSTGIVEFGVQGAKKIDSRSAKRTGNIDRGASDLLDGARYDDRYVVGYTDMQKIQKAWWRDERTEEGFSIRLYFVGKKLTDAGGKSMPTVVQKSIIVRPGDEEKFRSALFR